MSKKVAPLFPPKNRLEIAFEYPSFGVETAPMQMLLFDSAAQIPLPDEWARGRGWSQCNVVIGECSLAQEDEDPPCYWLKEQMFPAGLPWREIGMGKRQGKWL